MKQQRKQRVNKKNPRNSAANSPEIIEKVTENTNPIANIGQPIEALSKENKAMRVAINSSFEGPLPHPEIFNRYSEIIPDAPERILKQFEADSEHIRNMQANALEAQKQDNKRVHWMAWSLIAGGYVLAAYFANIDKLNENQ